MSTLKVNDIEEATVGGGKIWPARAWVNFNGSGTVAIRSDGNVSSITDGGIGIYTTNWTNNFPNVNYSATAAGGDADGDSNVFSGFMFFHSNGFSTSSLLGRNVNTTEGYDDATVISVHVIS